MRDKGTLKVCGFKHALVAVFMLLPACFAYKHDVEVMRVDVNSLKWESFEASKTLGEIKSSVSQLSYKVEELTTKTGPVNEQTLIAVRESQTSLNIKIEELAREVQALNGKFEERKFDVDNAVDGHSDELALMKDRLDAMEAALAKLSAAPVPQGNSVVKGPSPGDFYSAAYDLFKGKKYAESRAKFEDFLKEYPGDDLASNAQFWIAETFYAEADYESAILSYEAVLKKYKSSPKAPPALLKQAYAFVKLGDNRAAAGILKELIEKYPGSAQADAAKSKLKQIEEK